MLYRCKLTKKGYIQKLFFREADSAEEALESIDLLYGDKKHWVVDLDYLDDDQGEQDD